MSDDSSAAIKEIIIKVVLPNLLKGLIGAVVLLGFVLLAAGSFRYWPAYPAVTCLLLPMTISGIYYQLKVPGLLARRALKGRRLTSKQKLYLGYIYLAETALFLVPAFGFRYGLPLIPVIVIGVGNLLLVVANIVWMISKTANPYAGSALTIYEGHKLITSGPYRLIRHPNYFGDLLLILGVPLALGSYRGLVIFIGIIPAMIIMIKDEEDFLCQNLPGYSQYMKKVSKRIIPYLW